MFNLGIIASSHQLGGIVNISGATYNTYKPSNDTSSSGVFFKPDGLKYFIVGWANDRVFEYTLGTAWDISTATYTTNFSISAKESNAMALQFKADGTKMYILGYNKIVYQYALGTAWDVSSAVYETATASLTQLFLPQGMFFKPDDGTKLYCLSYGTYGIFQYTLSSPWDVSTATYDSISYVLSEESVPTGIYLSADGTKMLALGQTNDAVYQYTLGTAWDISTVSYDSVSVYVGGVAPNPQSVFLNSAYTKMYVLAYSALYEYNL